MTERRMLTQKRDAADNAITVRQIAAILQYDCGISACHAEHLASAVVNRATDLELPHLARYIASENVWRATVCDEDHARSLVTDAEPHTRIKLLNDVACVDLELERVYEGRIDHHEFVRARVHLKAHQDDLSTRHRTLADNLAARMARLECK